MKDYDVEFIATQNIKVDNAEDEQEAKDIARTMVAPEDFDIQTVNAHEVTHVSKTPA